ncbi:signal transduction histidine kinase [Clostridium pascui]|uniref:Cache 3/Cache 2 fusion domain-containing protein n=1 Tax=Clostridium pascui TaxID=46609 RepID=UPI00195B88C1|nr:Cache 3/Cache 2 fusion domain-containing protein [Clostridium pascui]MBM7871672.1 signal transduction histidine kinase [Clostridium pascui]
MNIKSKLMTSYLLLIVFSVCILGFLIATKSRTAVFNEITEKSERVSELINTTVSVRNNLLLEKVHCELYYVEKLILNSGEIIIDDKKQIQVGNFILPSMYIGDNKLPLPSALTDDIKQSTGAITSIFLLKDDKLIRVSTNVTTKDNKSAIGTFISSSSPVYRKIVNAESYYDSNLVEGNWLITGYKPLLDKNQKVIGAIALGYKTLNEYLEKTLSDIKIGQTGYVYIMNSKGDVLVHPNIKGQNIGNYDFSKKMFKSNNGVIEYKFNDISKLAAYKYFQPWDWYIVTTANYDDLKSSSKSILNMTLITVILILLTASILALFLANTLLKPINKLKHCMEIASSGDLTVRCDIKSKDEIGILSNSFNHMIKENKRLLEEKDHYDKLKTEFIANMSHELRTPLNIIFSAVQLSSLYMNNNPEGFANTKMKQHITIIKQNCYRLLRLVNNIIDITKIDSGFMESNLQNANIVEVIENITLSTAEYVESKSRNLIFDTDIEEKIMNFDLEKMERIMLNLISNATKFTKPGDTIEVNIYDKEEFILISVKDNGIGISQDNLKQIFERFKQVGPLLSRTHEGSGIGLSMVKSLVEMHDGTISVNSKYGEGTEFIIELPVKTILEEDISEPLNKLPHQINVEKIQIEFSDIYN